MADILSEGVVQRTDIVPYMNTGTEESPKWSQMGAGWTKFSESPNAQTKSKKYINEKTERESVTRYKPKFDFEADLMHANPTIKKVYDIARNRETGSGAIVDILIVDKIGEEPVDGYEARRMKLAVSVSSVDGDDDMTISGSLNGQSDDIKGKFVTSTSTFTANS